jgi:hypothetical protein
VYVTRQHLEGRRLASAVLTQQPEALLFGNSHAQMVHSHKGAVSLWNGKNNNNITYFMVK